MKNVLLALALVSSVITAACSGGTPTSPSVTPPPSGGGGNPGNPGGTTQTTMRVVEAISLAPVSDAVVTLMGKTATTGPDGRVVFDDITPTSSAEVAIERVGYLGPRRTTFGSGGDFTLIPDRAPADARFLGEMIFNGSSFLVRVNPGTVYLYITPELQGSAVMDAYRRGASAVSAATGGQVRFEVVTTEPPSSEVVFRVMVSAAVPSGAAAMTPRRFDNSLVIGGSIEYARKDYASSWELARHEIGHAIGLNHHAQAGVMHANTGYGIPDFTSAERAGIQFLFVRPPDTNFPDDDRRASSTRGASSGFQTSQIVCYFRP